MPRRVRLETFCAPPQSPAAADADTVVMDGDAFEEARLASYEEGYKAGWDDAAAAGEADGEGLRREAARNLQALAFTYHEARGHLMEGLGPLFDAICDRLLPDMAQAALGGMVRETLIPLAGAALDRPVTLVLNPAGRAAVEAALADSPAPPVDLVEDPTLGEAEVHLRGATEERRIDLDAAAAEIRAAITAFLAAPHATEAGPDTPTANEEFLKHG